MVGVAVRQKASADLGFEGCDLETANFSVELDRTIEVADKEINMADPPRPISHRSGLRELRDRFLHASLLAYDERLSRRLLPLSKRKRGIENATHMLESQQL